MADEQRRRVFHELDHDDSRWFSVAVPGHWAEVPELANEESVLYRRQFTGPDPNAPTPEATAVSTIPAPITTTGPIIINSNTYNEIEPRRWWLRFDGLAQQGDVWLDGVYLGHTDGYFVPHEMEITEQMANRHDHVLAVEATCRRFGNPNNRSTLTGALQDPELVGSNNLIVGGLWRSVRIRSSGQIAIRYARAICADVQLGVSYSKPTDAPRTHQQEHPQTQTHTRPWERARKRKQTHTRPWIRARKRKQTHTRPWIRARKRKQTHTRVRLALRAVLDVPHPTKVSLRTSVADTEHVHVHSAAAGENRVEWTVDVEDPELWWPHALGGQTLHDLTMEAVTGMVVHDRRRFRIGFRKVSMRRFVMYVNDERIHLKGANLLPVRMLLSTASSTEAAEDIRAARSAGLDLVRPVAHIARPELYDAADELGVLVWQDLPIRGLMNRSVGCEAYRQAREAVDLLGHHPALVVWCAHDEPFARPKRPTPLPPVAGRQQAPSWNRDVLDRRLCRILTRCDGSRPVVPHTAVPPHMSDPDGTTSNVWLGWRGGHASDLGKALARVPRIGRFVSAFGTPVTADAAEVTKTTIETLRRLKYRPNGGFLFSTLADAGDSDSNNTIGHGTSNTQTNGFGALDAKRRPKPSWAALVEACRPLIVVADHLPPRVSPGSQIDLAVHMVSDLHEAMDNLTVRARILRTNTLIASRAWTGTIRADECVLVGRIKATVPSRRSPTPLDQTSSVTRHTTPASHQPARSSGSGSRDLLVVELELEHEGTVVARNHYQTPIR